MMNNKKLFSIILALVLFLSCLASPLVVSANAEYRTWLQGDSRWGSITFGNVGDTMAKSGCAITSIAKIMVHSGSVPDDSTVFNPGILCNYLKSHGGFTSNGWIYWAKVDGYTSNFQYVTNCSLEGMSASEKVAKVKSYLDQGYSVVAMVKTGGHYVAVDRVAGGVVYIMDPASNSRTNLFDYDESGVTALRIFKGSSGSGSSGGTSSSFTPVVGAERTGLYKIRSSDGVNIRSGAGTSHAIVGAVGNGETVNVTEVSANWGRIQYQAVSGWICLDYADMVSPNLWKLSMDTPPAKTEYKTGESFDATGLSVLLTYTDGTQKKLTEGFSVSGFSEQVGTHTMTVRYLGLETTFTVTVLAAKSYYTGRYRIESSNGVNIRTSASTSADVAGVLDNQTEVTVTEVKENWGKISENGTEGWICLDYTTFLSGLLTGISVSSSRSCFLVGESLSFETIQVKERFSDGSEQTATSYEISGFNSSAPGDIVVTVSCKGFSEPLTFTIFEAVPAGDIDFDGKVSTSDALAALQYAVGKIDGAGLYISSGDMDGDGTITTADALIILQMAVKKI